jgi:hypothetical protein
LQGEASEKKIEGELKNLINNKWEDVWFCDSEPRVLQHYGSWGRGSCEGFMHYIGLAGGSL